MNPEAAERGLDGALGAVVEHGTGGGHGRRRMGDVVGQHLIHIGPAGLGKATYGLAHDTLGEFDHGHGGLQVGGGHGAKRYRRGPDW